MIDVPQLSTVLTLWSLLLVVVALYLVPLLASRAARLINVARTIEAQVKTALDAAGGIVQNTAPTKEALGQTLDAVDGLVSVGGQIDAHTAAIESVLTQRAATGAAR